MSNELYTVTQFLIDEFKLNPIVNTITFEKTVEIDFNKENIYPLVNIDLTSADPIGDMLTFNFNVSILQQRDYDNQLNNDKLLNKDNLIDNLNECMVIATRVINGVKSSNINDIEVLRLSSIEILKNVNTQNLDGVRFQLSLQIENTTTCGEF